MEEYIMLSYIFLVSWIYVRFRNSITNFLFAVTSITDKLCERYIGRNGMNLMNNMFWSGAPYCDIFYMHFP